MHARVAGQQMFRHIEITKRPLVIALEGRYAATHDICLWQPGLQLVGTLERIARRLPVDGIRIAHRQGYMGVGERGPRKREFGVRLDRSFEVTPGELYVLHA